MPLRAKVRPCAIGALELDCGATLPAVELNVETYGRFDGENAVLVCHSLTKTAHAAGPAVDGGPTGWWNDAIGPGRLLDTDRLFVICADALGAGRSSRPASLDPATGRPYGRRFPVFTVRDVARALNRALDVLGVGRLQLAVGGCFGGQQVLELTIHAPERVAAAVVIATTPATSAHSIAIFSAMRELIRSDPDYNDGDYYDGASPERGLRNAVLAALPLWMSREAMERRFARTTRSGRLGFTLEPEFEIELFMDRLGHGAGRHIDANGLMYLTRAVEYFDLVAEYGGLSNVASAISARTLFLSYAGDWRYPAAETSALHRALTAAGRDSRHRILDSPWGHGGFMYDSVGLIPAMREFQAELTRPAERRLAKAGDG